ncbi:MAG: sulfurtransferase [Candidatus Dadabacteria bacterium]|nr:sulfurtransferase [Candidatus Dadabacteria bacterium]MXZ12841.1 sulfurtransferase [Candidatus Dadabacteria bacterium]MYA48887.1 sulfurtransferase [Candidatus Dadabacteria bacterium]MYC39674.1 sulfurtransferase [Candidatus Dadabacteria bacterium]MYF47964.1 sulfurtransferase [Candidatus Dadabacteria bacterium]
MADYANPDVLVSTDWVEEHIDDPDIVIVESDEDILLYEIGHIRNSVKFDWQTELQDQLIRDYVSRENFEALLSEKGISNDHAVVFYGDRSNWWACYAFWTFKVLGHEKCLIMDGGRQKWVDEGRDLVKEVPERAKTDYKVSAVDESIRAFRDDVLEHMGSDKPLVDVRSPKEYSGELLHMEAYPQEGALRGGHIPGAVNVPWATAANEDGTFRSADELVEIYEKGQGLSKDQDVIAYCRIGERSSHTWFVLTYLLGFENVKNYDGSWTEWGNLVRAPIER